MHKTNQGIVYRAEQAHSYSAISSELAQFDFDVFIEELHTYIEVTIAFSHDEICQVTYTMLQSTPQDFLGDGNTYYYGLYQSEDDAAHVLFLPERPIFFPIPASKTISFGVFRRIHKRAPVNSEMTMAITTNEIEPTVTHDAGTLRATHDVVTNIACKSRSYKKRRY